MVNAYSTCLQCWRLIRNYDYIWRAIAYVWYPMTSPATSNMHKLNYVTDTIGWSRVQPSLLGEARGTERAAEIEPTVTLPYKHYTTRYNCIPWCVIYKMFPWIMRKSSYKNKKEKMAGRGFLHFHTTDFKSLPETNTSFAVMPGHDSSVGVPNV